MSKYTSKEIAAIQDKIYADEYEQFKQFGLENGCELKHYDNEKPDFTKADKVKFNDLRKIFSGWIACAALKQAKIDELQAKLDKAQKDVERIDFLADKEQWIANVQMPREIVERNLDDLRNAIDEAMEAVK